MSEMVLQPIELRQRGFSALVNALGWTNAVRFVQPFEKSSLNYTEERDLILPNLGAEELIAKLNFKQIPNK